MIVFPTKKLANFRSRHGRWLLGIVLTCSGCAAFSQAETTPEVVAPPAPPANVAVANRVVALGRLVPKGEVIQLSVPNAADSRVNQILVAEGDFVEAGQVIAILQGYERRQRDLEEAEKTVGVYQAKLNQMRAGDAKTAEIAAQREAIEALEVQQRHEIEERAAAIARAEAALSQAAVTYQRNQDLVAAGAISQQVLDESQEALDVARATLAERQAQLQNSQQTRTEQIERERATLATLQEVRPVDVQVAQAELERAQQRRADLADTQVRVPVAGQILRLNTRVGERVNTEEGIAELGQTNAMQAIAEVYETDILKVKVGQPATITSEYGGFTGILRGQVEHVGLQIGTRSLADGSTNPTTDENQRVVEVHIRVHPEDSPQVASLTNMQVRIEINTRAPETP
ncbi:MAG: HlyD family efflux transporter periplasmic adaptor subunit [Leptolyngbya sp. SIOISBB]|nr:HlyD family efflux transporter periplasmic adaptor subunit [Leptolyngbya sp. SIOISBB]